MKKILFVFMLTLLALAVNEANAQIRIGGGLFYNTETEKLGLNIRGAFGVSEKIDVVAKVNWMFPKKIGDDLKGTWTSFNGDVHYNLKDRDASFTPYAMAGLSMTFNGVKIGDEKDIDTYFGINVGAGFEYSITESVNLFVEGKYSVQKFEKIFLGMFVFSTGVVLPL